MKPTLSLTLLPSLRGLNKVCCIMLLALVPMLVFARGERQTVVFDVDLHCQGCIDKVERNIAFERGVKDLRCDLATKTVTVVFDPTKTDIPTLQAAFQKIKKPATVHQDAAPSSPAPSTNGSSCDTPATINTPSRASMPEQ